MVTLIMAGEGPISRDLGRELRNNTRFGLGKPDTELLVSRDTLKRETEEYVSWVYSFSAKSGVWDRMEDREVLMVRSAGPHASTSM